MAQLWPWLFLAGLGALHGLSPANGWLFAAACGVRARDGAAARRALLPVALGHGLSVALAVFAVLQGVLIGADTLRRIAGGGLILLAIGRWLRDAAGCWNNGTVRLRWLGRVRADPAAARSNAAGVGSASTRSRALRTAIAATNPGAAAAMPAGAKTFAAHAGIALWSCLMATVHGAGLMLVPALVPLCLSDSPARAITASGSLPLALAAIGVHLAAMLLTAGLIAAGVCRGMARLPALPAGALRQAWTAALGATGGLLLASM
ncbi:hypothetical protein [Tahibacter harae]|uniref:Nickel/cobalt efflux system n=1 Tax=Tahibacter harae TaxID=2963937 RepID=A0ABT1QKV0_9GAMM|nr:hypothetical protein [Tahibacter harae]MCQ4163139.1 hypothetical protein [Tahibacter harae]